MVGENKNESLVSTPDSPEQPETPEAASEPEVLADIPVEPTETSLSTTAEDVEDLCDEVTAFAVIDSRDDDDDVTYNETSSHVPKGDYCHRSREDAIIMPGVPLMVMDDDDLTEHTMED